MSFDDFNNHEVVLKEINQIIKAFPSFLETENIINNLIASEILKANS